MKKRVPHRDWHLSTERVQCSSITDLRKDGSSNTRTSNLLLARPSALPTTAPHNHIIC